MALKFGRRGGNRGVATILISSLVVRKVKGLWMECLLLIQPTMDSPFLHFAVNLVHPI